MIGESADLTYAYEHLGAGPDSLSRLAAGEGAFYEKLKAAKRPLIIVGQGALVGENGLAVLSAAAKLALDVGAVAEDWNGFSVLHTAAARVGGLDLGFVPGEGRASARGRSSPARRSSISCSCSASTRSRSRTGRSSSISARMATRARIAPT